jgi:hypothetical protein
VTETVEVARERIVELTKIERRVRALWAYYTDEDLAAHLSLSVAEPETVITEETTVRKVWVNRKLVHAFTELRKDLGL